MTMKEGNTGSQSVRRLFPLETGELFTRSVEPESENDEQEALPLRMWD